MAEGGRLGGSVKGFDYDYNCSDCLTRNGTCTEAIFYCPECDKNNCRQCYVCDHDVIGRRNMDRWGHPSKRAQFDPCKKHKGQLLQLYCRKHDVVCCPACSQSEHKSCGDSVYIPLVANANENKAGLNKVKKGLGKLHLKADKVSKDKTTKLTDLDQTEQRLVTGVREFRARVDSLLDDMEKISLDDIAQFKTLFKDRYRSDLDVCVTVKTEVSELQKKLDSASTDESLLFSRIKQGNEQVRDNNHLLSDITSSDKIEFEPHTEIETLLKSLHGLGKMLTDPSVGNPHSPGSGRVKKRHSQGLGSQPVTSNTPYRTVKKTRFNVKAKQDKNTCHIWGMCMMPSGNLILADYMNDSLKKVSSQYEVTTSCSLPAGPRDVCHTEADQVAVALWGQTVQLVTVSGSMSCTSSFSTDHYCNSLAYSNKCLYIISGHICTAVNVYNLTGTRLRAITQDQHGNQLFSSCISHFTTSPDGERLHITDGKGLVTIETKGNLITRFTSDELSDGAHAVCTDGEDNVFVGGTRSNSVMQVGGEADKKLAKLLSHSDRIQVHALCFDGVHTRLLVASHNSNTVHVLHLST